jgi:hypothetical protein
MLCKCFFLKLLSITEDSGHRVERPPRKMGLLRNEYILLYYTLAPNLNGENVSKGALAKPLSELLKYSGFRTVSSI